MNTKWAINSLFAVHTSLLGDEIPWNQALLSCGQMLILDIIFNFCSFLKINYYAHNNSPPIALGVVDDFHAIALHERHISIFSRIVIV
jgi:hypothetical protein